MLATRSRLLAGLVAAGIIFSLAVVVIWQAQGGASDARAATNAQAAAAADGQITWAEYESAIWGAFECVKASGLTPMAEPHLNAEGTRLTYAFFAHEGEGKRGVGVNCMEEHSMLVEQLWAAQQRPSAETVAAATSAMDRCLVDGGYDEAEVAAAASFTAFEGRADGGAYFDCVRAVSIEYRVGWWAGD